MEKLGKMNPKNVYLLLAMATVSFVSVWVYEKMIKPVIIRSQVSRIIKNIEAEEKAQNK